MGIRCLTGGLLAGALTLASGVALADGDAEDGKKVFNKCKACHVVDDEKNRVGPHLVGIIGRPAGTVEGFKYSDAMKNSGITWDEVTIAEYLADPGLHPRQQDGLRRSEEGRRHRGRDRLSGLTVTASRPRRGLIAAGNPDGPPEVPARAVVAQWRLAEAQLR